MNQRLSVIARKEAEKGFHGNIEGAASNLQPIADLFPVSPPWELENWDNCWCAAFVYYCCLTAGIELPVKYPNEYVKTDFSGCLAWEQWAKLEENGYWHDAEEEDFTPEVGDIILYDRVFINDEHDHMGIIIEVHDSYMLTAEGNHDNRSAIVKRPFDYHVRGYVRF